MESKATGLTRHAFRFPVRLGTRKREYLAFLSFALPNIIVLLVWAYWPFVQSLYLSFTNWDAIGPTKQLIGLGNYIRLLDDDVFRQVVVNTLVFTFVTVFIRLILSLALAVLLNQWLIGIGFWRLVIFSPHITTSAAMALVWLGMYDPHYGPLASVLASVGVKFPNIMGDVHYALPGLMVVGIWKSLGFSTVVFLAALQGVRQDLLDAAAVDGAKAWQSFRHVSLPSISPVTYFLVVTGLIGTFQTFDLVSVMTRGGPANATNLYVYRLYQEAFHYFRIGYASSLAVVMLVVIIAFTYVQARFSETWVHYS